MGPGRLRLTKSNGKKRVTQPTERTSGSWFAVPYASAAGAGGNGETHRTAAEKTITATQKISMPVSPIFNHPRTGAPLLTMFQNLPVIS